MIGNLQRLILTSFIIVSGSLWAQAQVDMSFAKQKISINQNVNLIVTIENSQSSPQFDVTSLLDDFVVIGQRTETFYNQVNGDVSFGNQYIFTLKPLKSGRFSYSDWVVNLDGQPFTIRPLTIEVLDGTSAQGSQSKTEQKDTALPLNEADRLATQYGFFGIAEVDKTDVYFGEEIKYTLEFYHRAHLFDVGLSNPDFSDFWMEQHQTRSKSRRDILSGRRFYVTQLLDASLYPVTSGELTINPLKIEFVSGQSFGGVKSLETNPVVINVKPLPTEGKPRHFSGSVGEFTMQSSVDKTELAQYSPLTLTAFVSGEGNLSTLQGLDFDNDDRFKIYQSKSEIGMLDGQEGRLFEYIIVPNEAGDVTLPEFSLNYFSPKKEAYQEIRTAPLIIAVSESEVGASAVATSDDTQSDIRYVKQGVPLKNRTTRAVDAVGFLVVLVLSGIGLVGQVAWNYRDRFTFINSRKIMLQKAHKKAVDDLESLKVAPKVSLTSIENILLDYLSTVVGTSLLGLTQDQLLESLHPLSISNDLRSSLEAFMKDLSFIAYAPASLNDLKATEILEQSIALVDGFHKEVLS